MAPPTAWPVLPPGIGMLNIIITKEKAAARARSGTWRVLSSLLSLRPAYSHMGIMMIHMAI